MGVASFKQQLSEKEKSRPHVSIEVDPIWRYGFTQGNAQDDGSHVFVERLSPALPKNSTVCAAT